MRFIQGFFMSFGMFCAIPCPYRPWNEKARNLMVSFLPVVGLVIGILWYLLYLAVEKLGLPLQLQTACLMLYPFLVTGFIHLDGYMDTSDAILSRRPLEEKLRILKDPHTGAFAVISLAVLFIICFASVLAVLENIHFETALGMQETNPIFSLILIPAITRCCSALVVLKGKPLSHSQYGGEFHQDKKIGEAIFILIVGLLCFTAAIAAGFREKGFSYAIIAVLLVAVLTYIVSILYAKKQLGGVSGDLAGYAMTLAEAGAMVAMALI